MSTLMHAKGMRNTVIAGLFLCIAPAWAAGTDNAKKTDASTQGESVDCFYEQYAADPACKKTAKDVAIHAQPKKRQTAGVKSDDGALKPASDE